MKRAQIFNFTQNLASAALAETIENKVATFGYSGCDYELTEVLLNFSVAESETVTVSYINSAGANYTFTLDKQTLSAQSSYVFRPTIPVVVGSLDSIEIACTNANNTGTVYGVAKFKPVL